MRQGIRLVAQVIGIVTMVLLVVYGGFALLGDPEINWRYGQAVHAESINLASTQQHPELKDVSGGGGNTAPPYLNYQGILKDAEGATLSGTYTMTFRIYSGPADETEIWSQQLSGITVRDGHFSVLLGDGNPITPEIFAAPDRYIGVTLQGYDEMKPRQRFASIPYALTAESVSSLDAADGDPDDVVSVDNNGLLDVWGPSNLHGDVGVDGNMYVSGDMVVRGHTDLNGSVGIGDRMYVAREVDFGSSLHVNGYSDVGSLRVRDQTELNGNVGVGGSMHVVGDITWNGALASLVLTDPNGFTAKDGDDWIEKPLWHAGHSLCFLTQVELESIDHDKQSAGCKVYIKNNTWYGAARANDADSNAWCEARCLLWGP